MKVWQEPVFTVLPMSVFKILNIPLIDTFCVLDLVNGRTKIGSSRSGSWASYIVTRSINCLGHLESITFKIAMLF